MRLHYGGQLGVAFRVVLVGFCMGVFAVLMAPNFDGRAPRSNLRVCFENQKFLTGAYEMYELDFQTKVEVLDDALLQTFVTEGYLQRIPDDPGAGPGSQSNYFLARGKVMCLRHGFVRPPPGAQPRTSGMDQLAALGIDPGREPLAGVPASLGGADRTRRSLAGLLDLGALFLGVGGALLFWLGALVAGGLLILEVVARLSHGPPTPVASPAPTAPSKVDLSAAKCPVCADGFGAGTPVASLCPTCQTPHHEPCLRYIGHCAVFACSRTELSEQRRREAVAEKAKSATG